MVKKSLILSITFMVIIISGICQTKSIEGTFGINVGLNSLEVNIGDEEILNKFFYNTLGFEFDYFPSDNIELGFLAGYSFKHFEENIFFIQLPVSLSLEKKKINSMYFGTRITWQPIYWEDFFINIRGCLTFFKLFKINNEIQFPSITGSSELKSSFFQTSLAVFLNWDKLSGITLFCGPKLNLTGGKIIASQQLGSISGDQTLVFNQIRPLGLCLGAVVEIFETFEIKLRMDIISQLSLQCGVFYEF